MNRSKGMPIYVYVGLWGIKSRTVAKLFMVVCLALGISGCLLASDSALFPFGVLFLIAGSWYAYSIRWASKNSAWGDR